MAFVRNIQTGVDYADFNAALVALPPAPWPTGGYELRQFDLGTYNATINVTSGVVDPTALTASSPLLLSAGDAGTVLQADPLFTSNMLIKGVSYVTVAGFVFLGGPVASGDEAQLQIGTAAEGATHITVQGGFFAAKATPAEHCISIPSSAIPSSDITISGSVIALNIQGAQGSAITATDVSALVIEDCASLQNNESESAITLTRCTGVRMSRIHSAVNDGRTLHAVDTTQLTIVNCLFSGAPSTSAHTAYEVLKIEPGPVTETQFDIYNNTFRLMFTDPAHFAQLINVGLPSSPSTIRNNIYYMSNIGAFGPFYAYRFSSTAARQLVSSVGNCFYLGDLNARIAYDGTTIYSALTDWRVTGEDAASTGIGVPGSVEADPLFVNPASDPKLQNTSPAIDIGYNTGLTIDFFGESRIVGPLPDAGAAENQTQAPAITFTPDTVEDNGGYRISLTGLVIADGNYTVSVGPYGSPVTSTICYGGAYGHGNNVAFISGSGIFVSPPLPAGGPYPVTVASVATSGSYHIPSGVSVVYNNHRSESYSVRSILLPWWQTGPRKVDDEDPQT